MIEVIAVGTAATLAAWDIGRRYLALKRFDKTEMQALRDELLKHRDQMFGKCERNEQAIKAALAETKAAYDDTKQQLASVRLSRGVQGR